MTTPSRPDPLPMVLVVLTVTTGLVDAVSVLGLERVFTANMCCRDQSGTNWLDRTTKLRQGEQSQQDIMRKAAARPHLRPRW